LKVCTRQEINIKNEIRIKIKDHLSLIRFSLLTNNEIVDEMRINIDPIANADGKKKIPIKNRFSENLLSFISKYIFEILN
tara:strand:- start:273 stop:512 length:240 start_codon:yes stop_codon:yes gene_type:complete